MILDRRRKVRIWTSLCLMIMKLNIDTMSCTVNFTTITIRYTVFGTYSVRI